ncbi:cytochrome P450 [Aspergillus glaucus CBS 516.65]|uniref:Uncharacterized protein n=1 Tax=Aspergillus glaucus CBS 516.65 TaxID=1160497 RepID=A0A1L9VTT5_ASPGL|nr:hypothetical protein ASPGLDRAFT_144128 [Aspergillus glaucus CBS 516.65]OJJ87319.1 hypothetical protein ASPGLDRAFT_144128 [Aspergillus glaucus CBS 516.65]
MINVFIVLAALYSLYFFGCAIWNIYYHPLQKIPGPKLWIAFPIFRHISLVRGQLETDIKAFHGKYGKVVRFSTAEVSFITAKAWREIYNDLPKAELSTNVPLGINNANDKNHRRYRKALAHSFSTKALTTQEPVLIEYTDKLIKRLKGFAESQRPADMVKWYNSTTFDLIGDLAFGVSFGNLDTDGYHFWVSNVFQAVRGIVMGTIKDAYPVLFKLFSFAFGLDRFSDARARQLEYSSSTMQKRLAHKKPRDLVDFMDGFLRSKDNITVEEMEANANLLIIAGSDTTATLLSGTTYYLLRTPRALEKATQEVRSAFKSESEINFLNTTARLPYMVACLNEGMRMYPPVPSILQRVAVSAEPIEISGYYISQGTKVGVHQFAANTSPINFYNPGNFIPERWLPEIKKDPSSPFYNDSRDVCQVFSYGPRDCIGKNLAYAEMRVILARMLWNFDLKICEESNNWNKQRTFTLWEKSPLMVQLRLRGGG